MEDGCPLLRGRVTSHGATHTSCPPHTHKHTRQFLNFFIFYYFCHEKYKESSPGVGACSLSPPEATLCHGGWPCSRSGGFSPCWVPPDKWWGAEAEAPGVQLLLLLNRGSPRPTDPAGAGAAWRPGVGVPRVEPPGVGSELGGWRQPQRPGSLAHPQGRAHT